MVNCFPQGHPTLCLSEKVKDVCKDFFNSFNLSLFAFGRFYRGEHFAFLVTHPDLLLDWAERISFKLTIPDAYLYHQSFSLLWEDTLSEEFLKIIKEHYQLDHGLTLINRYKDSYDTFSFAKPQGQLSSAQSFYLNNIIAFENFSEQILKVGKDLIKIVEKERVSIPTQNQSDPEVFLPKKSKRHRIQGRFGETHITTQELLCFQLLCRGKVYKDIANILGISVRTVETYILRLKDRTGYSIDELLFKI